VRTPADIDRLGVPRPRQELKYVTDAVARVRRELNGRVPSSLCRQPMDRGDLHGGRRSSKTFV